VVVADDDSMIINVAEETASKKQQQKKCNVLWKNGSMQGHSYKGVQADTTGTKDMSITTGDVQDAISTSSSVGGFVVASAQEKHHFEKQLSTTNLQYTTNATKQGLQKQTIGAFSESAPLLLFSPYIALYLLPTDDCLYPSEYRHQQLQDEGWFAL